MKPFSDLPSARLKVPLGAAQKNVDAQILGTVGPAANGFGRRNILACL
jgi:hypothetical protein